MNRSAFIYKIENRVNGGCYIGSTVNPKNRWMHHRTSLRKGRHHSFVLQKAWDKYGESCFEFKVLLECSEADRLFYEKLCMPLQKYNVLRTPHETPIRKNWVRTPEICAKISAGLQKVVHTPEHKGKMRLVNLGRKWPRSAVEKTARAKWKPVFCKELQVSFLSMKAAAEHFGVGNSTITEAVRRKGKVNKMFTLVKVA